MQLDLSCRSTRRRVVSTLEAGERNVMEREPGRVIGDLEWRVGALGEDAKRYRDEADELTVKAYRLRAKADVADLEAVECRSAANLLRQVGFRVDRTPDGIPRLTVDRPLAPSEITS
jgi:hypothetical protein